MSSNEPALAERDPTVARIAEVSLRMMAGALSDQARRALRDLATTSGTEYPWQRVVDVALRDPVDASELVHRGLVAQRDWIQRLDAPAAGPARVGRPERGRRPWLKVAVAFVLVRGLSYLLLGAACLALLLLLKARWPGVDVYRLLDWARGVLPAVFGPG